MTARLVRSGHAVVDFVTDPETGGIVRKQRGRRMRRIEWEPVELILGGLGGWLIRLGIATALLTGAGVLLAPAGTGTETIQRLQADGIMPSADTEGKSK